MSLITYIKKPALSPYFQSALLLLICLFATIQAIGNDEIANFVIFKTATQRFFTHTNMYEYIEYGIIWDKFLYAPCFVMLFLPFAYLPVGISIFLWLAAGAALFFFALKKLPLTETQRALVFFIALIDLVNSMQNLQTNVLNTAFMLLIFSSLHNQKPVWTGFFTALCLGIKIYPAASALSLLPRETKIFGKYRAFYARSFLGSVPVCACRLLPKLPAELEANVDRRYRHFRCRQIRFAHWSKLYLAVKTYLSTLYTNWRFIIGIFAVA